MAYCHHHDVFDWFGVIGPTLAAAAAALVAWRVGRSTEALQRQLARPMLRLKCVCRNAGNGTHYRLSLNNAGSSGATVASFTVFTDGINFPPNADEAAAAYWRRALLAIDETMQPMTLGGSRVDESLILATGHVIGPQSETVILEAGLQGDFARLLSLVKKLTVRITCRSPGGESISVANDHIEIH
jgi:hypothetical protein